MLAILQKLQHEYLLLHVHTSKFSIIISGVMKNSITYSDSGSGIELIVNNRIY